MSRISVAGISKWFHRRGDAPLQVLSDICIEIGTGKSVAIVGASGSGKSTLLNIIAGLTDSDGGRVLIDGREQRAGQTSAAMAYMFQEDRLLPWRSAAGNVRFGIETLGLPRAEQDRRVRSVLELVGLAEFANAYPHELSGGMRSRVALARSLAPEPQILLMDEPFSKLDPATRSQMHAEVVRIAAERAVTIVFVTHDVEEAVVLADEVVVLQPRPGRVKEVVPLQLAHPRDPVLPMVSDAVRDLRQRSDHSAAAPIYH